MIDKTTSDKNVVKTAPVEVSPLSTLPPGLDEGRYRVANSDGTGEGGGPDFINLDLNPNTGTTHLLDTPESVFIKSQTLRYGPDGKLVTDVVVTVADVKGATNYEIRTALVN